MCLNPKDTTMMEALADHYIRFMDDRVTMHPNEKQVLTMYNWWLCSNYDVKPKDIINVQYASEIY